VTFKRCVCVVLLAALAAVIVQPARAEAMEPMTIMLIAGAGMSAALPGVAAAHTDLPVIGVPILGKTLGGLDALLSVAQMPPGVPVGCVAIDGARNAGLLAVRIINA